MTTTANGIERVPWNKIFSYDADVTCVADARGRGKTFGMREQFLRDAVRDGLNFVQIVRTETRIPQISTGFFDALYKPDAEGVATSAYAREHPAVFRRVGHDYLWQPVPPDARDDPRWRPSKRAWERCGYFVSLSKAQQYKEQTFVNVRRLCLDEALIERPTGRNNYLPYEYVDLVSLVSSCTREQPGDGRHKPNVYLLSNACSIVNPYFQHYGIDHVPPDGLSWWGNKTFLLYVGHDSEYGEAMATGTVAGRMAQGTRAAGMINDNRFVTTRDWAVARKPSRAQFTYGFVCNGAEYGVWSDMREGCFYVTSRIPRNASPVFALTASDNGVNYVMAARAQPIMQRLYDMHTWHMVRFESAAMQERCEREVFSLYGMRQ